MPRRTHCELQARSTARGRPYALDHPALHTAAADQQLPGVERGELRGRKRLRNLSQHAPEAADPVPQRRQPQDPLTSTKVVDRGWHTLRALRGRARTAPGSRGAVLTLE